jgi:hypothetical protein
MEKIKSKIQLESKLLAGGIRSGICKPGFNHVAIVLQNNRSDKKLKKILKILNSSKKRASVMRAFSL